MRFWKPRRLHAEDMLRRILMEIKKMTAQMDTLNTSVTRLLSDVATELRNHPNAQDDGGQLLGIAAKLDTASAEIEANQPSDGAAQADPAQVTSNQPASGDQPTPPAA